MPEMNVPLNFTEQIRDWAVMPYVSIEVQDDPCNGKQEPLFARYWNGTRAVRDCETTLVDGSETDNCTTIMASIARNQIVFWAKPIPSNDTRRLQDLTNAQFKD